MKDRKYNRAMFILSLTYDMEYLNKLTSFEVKELYKEKYGK